jgi:hypothetical protein
MKAILTDPGEVRRRTAAARPLSGAAVPSDIRHRLGATHYDGKYFLTSEPYLVEGARKLHDLGLGVAKFWLDRNMVGYSFNSDWPYSARDRLSPLDEIIRHDLYRRAFEPPFSTILLEVGPLLRDGGPCHPDFDFDSHEREVLGVARHLFRMYADREITFVLQNWEGDWIFRGSFDRDWPARVSSAEIDRRADAMVRWFTCRQRAVDIARSECPTARCRVLHAAEVNKVHDADLGLPTLLTHVLPRARVDMLSWSCYDGLDDEVSLWHGVEKLRQCPCPDPSRRPVVFIGEIGLPEHDKSRQQVRDWWDIRLGALLALDIPLIVHWELYCNEPRDGVGRHDAMVRPAEIMNGFWLLRPDGTRSHGCDVLLEAIRNGGPHLPT